MTENPIQKLAQLLTDASQPEVTRSAQAIAVAISWNREMLNNVPTRAGLLTGLSELVKALSIGRDAYSEMELLIDRANPSPTLREKIKSEQVSLAQNTAKIMDLKSQVAKLEQLQLDNQGLLEEQRILQSRRQELAILETFDSSVVSSLRQQVQALQEAKPWLLALESQVNQLNIEIPAVAKLSGDALMILQEKDRQFLKNIQQDFENIKAGASQKSSQLELIKQNIATITAETAEIEKRFANAKEELRQKKEILDEYYRADQEIARAINNWESKSAQQLLNDIEAKLKSADEALRLAIEANEKAHKIESKVIPL